MSTYEIILVNDGSPNNSLETALALQIVDPHIKIIELSRNFGHHKAIMTGLSYAKGNKVFLIDCDLEEPPELLGSFWRELHSSDTLDYVFGEQESRKGKLYEKLSGSLFYKFFNAISEIKIPVNFLTIRLMTKRYVQALQLFQEKEFTIAIVIELTGFTGSSLVVKKGSKGTTSYSFMKKFNVFVNAIISSSSRPLWIIFYMGLIITILSFLFAVRIIAGKLIFQSIVDGWTSLIVAICFFGGINIFVLGVIGIYLSKVFAETKQRPVSIIKQIYETNSFIEEVP